jgi:hypothetical protein
MPFPDVNVHGLMVVHVEEKFEAVTDQQCGHGAGASDIVT